MVARTAREDEEWSTTVSRAIRVTMLGSFILMLESGADDDDDDDDG